MWWNQNPDSSSQIPHISTCWLVCPWESLRILWLGCKLSEGNFLVSFLFDDLKCWQSALWPLGMIWTDYDVDYWGRVLSSAWWKVTVHSMLNLILFIVEWGDIKKKRYPSLEWGNICNGLVFRNQGQSRHFYQQLFYLEKSPANLFLGKGGCHWDESTKDKRRDGSGTDWGLFSQETRDDLELYAQKGRSKATQVLDTWKAGRAGVCRQGGFGVHFIMLWL